MTDAKSKILARRARFLAAAAASAGLVACSSTETTPTTDAATDGGVTDTSPMPCLSPAIDSGADTNPMPCLTPVEDTGTPEDAATDGSGD